MNITTFAISWILVIVYRVIIMQSGKLTLVWRLFKTASENDEEEQTLDGLKKRNQTFNITHYF